jgi:hypothetical protein
MIQWMEVSLRSTREVRKVKSPEGNIIRLQTQMGVPVSWAFPFTQTKTPPRRSRVVGVLVYAGWNAPFFFVDLVVWAAKN